METIADAFAGGVESGNKMIQGMQDTQNYQQDKQLQREALSQKVESQRMLLDNAKEQEALSLQSKAGLAKAQADHADIQIGDIGGQIKLLGSAIQDNKSNPELVDSYRTQMENLMLRQGQLGTVQAKAREEQKQQVFDTIRGAMFDPESGATKLRQLSSTVNEPGLTHIADVFENKVPLPSGKFFKDLSQGERDNFEVDLNRQLGPKGAERTAADIERDRARTAETERKTQADLNATLLKAQLLAAKQAGDADKARALEAKSRDKTNQITNLTAKHDMDKAKLETELYGNGTKLHPGIPETIPNPDYSMWNPSNHEPAQIPNPAFLKKQATLTTMEENFNSSLDLLSRADQTGATPPPKDTLSEEDKQAIAWAKANPKDSRAVQILKQHGM